MIQPKVWLSWLKWVSWFVYSYEALLVNQWSGMEGIACSPEAPNACLSSGKEVGYWVIHRGEYLSDNRPRVCGRENLTEELAQVNNVFTLQVLQWLSFKEENLVRDICVLLLLAVAIRSSFSSANYVSPL